MLFVIFKLIYNFILVISFLIFLNYIFFIDFEFIYNFFNLIMFYIYNLDYNLNYNLINGNECINGLNDSIEQLVTEMRSTASNLTNQVARVKANNNIAFRNSVSYFSTVCDSLSWSYKKVLLVKNYKTLELEKLKIEPIVAHLKEPNNGKYSLNFFAQNIPNFPKKDDLYIVSYSNGHYISIINIFSNHNNFIIPVEFFRGKFKSGFVHNNNFFDYLEYRVPLLRNNDYMPLYSSINLCSNEIYEKVEYSLITGIKLSAKLLIEQKLLLDNDICYFGNLKNLFGDKYQNMSVKQFIEVINNLSEDEIYRFLKKEKYDYKLEDTENFVNYSKSLNGYLKNNKKLDYEFVEKMKSIINENKYYMTNQEIRYYLPEYENVDDFINDFMKLGQVINIVSKFSMSSDIVEIISITANNGILKNELINYNSICQVGYYIDINHDFFTGTYKYKLNSFKNIQTLHFLQQNNVNNILLNNIEYKNCIIQNLDNIEDFKYSLKNITEEILCGDNNLNKFNNILLMNKIDIKSFLSFQKNYIDIYRNVLKNDDMLKFYMEYLEKDLSSFVVKHDKKFLDMCRLIVDPREESQSFKVLRVFKSSCDYLKFFIKKD